MTRETKPRGQPFKPGQSGNPDGRPKGIPNGITKAARQRIAEDCDPLGFLASVMKGEPQAYTVDVGADDGEGSLAYHTPSMADRMNAARSLANKLAPDAKDRPLTFKVGTINAPADALAAMGRVVEAMSDGDLTASEAAGVMAVVMTYLDAWKVTDFDARLKAIEEAGR